MFCFCTTAVIAGEAEILAAELRHQQKNSWSINVTLKHEDTGWDHYADVWRVIDKKENELGYRVLAHPHIEEQPVTRGFDRLIIHEDINTIYIQGHDNVHGWSSNKLKVMLTEVQNGYIRVVTDK